MQTLADLGIDRMTVARRIALVQDVLDSVAAEPLSDVQKQDLAELRDRLRTVTSAQHTAAGQARA